MNQGKRGARSLYCKWRNTSLVVGAALIGMAVWIVAPSVTAYVDAERSLVSVQEYEALLIASRALSAERGPSNVLMSVEVGADPSAVIRLKEARRATDTALSVVDRTRNLPLAPGIVRSLREALGLARDRIDGIAQMPYAERTLDMMTEAISAMFGIADEIQPTVELAAETLEKKNPALAGSVFTALVVTNLRDQAGRLASHIVPSISRALPLSPTAAGRVDRTQGRIDQLMQMLGVRLDVSDAGLRALMGEVRRLFIGRGVRLIEKLTLEGRAGGHYSIAPAGLTGLYVPTLVPLEGLRKATIHQMVTDIVRSRDIAFIRLIGMAAATVLLLVLLVVVMRRLFLSVLRPLLTAHEMIVGLAEERPVGRPGFEADTRELNDLFDAIARLEGQLAERRELTERLRVRAETDPLTGLLNRARFFGLGDTRFAAAMGDAAMARTTEARTAPPDSAPPDTAQSERAEADTLEAGSRIGVLYIDLDGFKGVNDTLGHFAGDHLLRDIAVRLSNAVGPESLLARLGGDEFAICTPVPDAAGLEAFARHILLQFNRPIDINGIPIRVGASIGLALMTDGDGTEARVLSFSQLCCNADIALYDAKRSSRNTYRIFGGAVEKPMPERRALAG
ncbi:GGDEF domain-containing protein [Rhizobium sp. 9140]|uniref:GGDEF domain-containing protein n=1 Tax=Rhizobium sp. 9140 TaxID=1761900 RepID=UPI000792FFAA|nr:GGDEF domain-containing protein [Rhizobium sp. 9140]CZT34470.1 diguanylate cyclase (GGDEF) domain-containing protein [Rhizobium sp. 9140]